MNKAALYIYMVVMVMAFSGCNDSEKWKVGSENSFILPHGPINPNTGQYRCLLEDATLVIPGTIVRPLSEDTQVRIWHFQNSQEYVCLLQGDAIIITKN